MNRKELIKRLMNVAENYKNSYLFRTGALTDIGVLVDEYTDTVVKNCSIPDVVGQSEQLFCPYCGDKRQLKVESDLNSGRVCKSRLCKGK